MTNDFDVLVVGAGLSGVGAGYRLQTECPTKTYAILEARDVIGGTWDLFRYPGVRSDSDMFTLGYPFHPWKEAKAIADGPSILSYIRETAARFGVDKHIRFRHKITGASWSSASSQWTVDVDASGEKKTFTCRFLYLCAGYYSYDQAHDPGLPGIKDFGGQVIHPQWWPEKLDYTGKKVVVVGSGATAVTIVPAMTDRAAHVTMLQRSPTWIMSMPAKDKIADVMRAVLPARVAHDLARSKNVLLATAMYQFCKRWPDRAGKILKKQIRQLLPEGYPVEPDFAPRYNPWDQRLCLVPDADLFDAIKAGKASIVTDQIETFTKTGVKLKSGKTLDADIVVTATGLKIQPLGNVKLSVDGRAIAPNDVVVYKGLMLSGVPNLAWCVGYTNASWTLRADLSSRYVCRLLNLMDRKGWKRAEPRADLSKGERRPLLDLSSGYVLRAADTLPAQGTHAPWYLRQNYILDFMTMKLGRVDDAMTFA